MNNSNICLILPIEKSKKILNDFNVVECRYYEEELVKCIKYWRSNTGILKDISIYVINMYNILIPLYINNVLKLYNVKVLSNDKYKDFKFDGFYSIPFIGMFCEENKLIKEQILIKIDIDMYALRELSEEHIKYAEDGKVAIGQYDKFTVPDSRIMYGNVFPLTTDYIICNKKLRFYTQYYNMLLNKTVILSNKYSKMLNITEYFIDELIVDEMYANKLFDFKPISYYEVKGEYGEKDILDYIRYAGRNPLFLHYHLTNNKAIDFKLFNFLRTFNRGL